MKILCVDDNEWIGDLYQQLLAKAGHQIRTATDGRVAWDLLAADLGAFDLVILDYRMPGLNGLELVSRLKQAGYGGRIVVQSGFLTQEAESAFKAFHVDRIIHKPFGLSTILEVVDQLSPRSRSG